MARRLINRLPLLLAALLLLVAATASLAAPQQAATDNAWKRTAGATAAASAAGGAITADTAASADNRGGRRPYFCQGLDCPTFQVLETAGDVQLRRYDSAHYVVTHVEAESLFAAQLEGTRRLLAYLAGANEDGEKLLPPTVPLETILSPRSASAETVDGRFCILLYLPESAQRHPPRPSDRRVHVVKARSTDWFVLRISSPFLDERSVIHRAWGFIRQLEEERGRCAINRRVVSFGVYSLPLPFIKPGYFEIGVPRRRRHSSLGDAPGDAPGDDDGCDTPPISEGEGPEDTGVDACEVCGDCGDSGGSDGPTTVGAAAAV